MPNLAGHHICVSAGPTREPLDPVRYLSNNSSGKMGYQIAEALIHAGATVTLLTGPVCLPAPPGVHIRSFTTAHELLELSTSLLPEIDAYIACAAICDYRPKTYVPYKLKKRHQTLTHIELEENPDILRTLCQMRSKLPQPAPLMIGFAAETDHMIEHAQSKFSRKGCDLIVGACVSTSGSGFGSNTLDAAFIDSNGVQKLGIIEKSCLAFMIVERLGLEINKHAR